MNETNGQPLQTSLETDNATEIPPVAQSTTEIMPPGTEKSDTGRAYTQQLTEEIALPNLLPSGIEIIEEKSSQASMELDSGGKSPSASVSEPDPMSQRPQSPDYSPSLLRLLGTNNSSSGESFQPYFARKLVDREEEEEVKKIGEPGPSSRQNIGSKTSVSEAITLTPAANSPTGTPGLSATTPVVTFLGPPGLNASQTESERPRSSTKRLRAGSYSASGIQPPPKFGLKSSYLIRQSPSGQEDDSTKSRNTRSQDEIPSTSAIEPESDLEVVTDPPAWIPGLEISTVS